MSEWTRSGTYRQPQHCGYCFRAIVGNSDTHPPGYCSHRCGELAAERDAARDQPERPEAA